MPRRQGESVIFDGFNCLAISAKLSASFNSGWIQPHLVHLYCQNCPTNGVKHPLTKHTMYREAEGGSRVQGPGEKGNVSSLQHGAD